MGEFGVQAENSDEQQNEKHIGFDDAGEKFLACGKLEFLARVVGEGELLRFAVEAGDFAAVEFVKQVILVIADEVDEMAIQGLFFGERAGFGNGSFGELWIAVAFFGKAAQERGGIVVDFLAQDLVDGHGEKVGQKDWSSGAGACSGGHGSDVRGKKDQKAGGSAAGAGGSHVDGDRDRGIENVINDIGHRVA